MDGRPASHGTARSFTIDTEAGKLTAYVDQTQARIPLLNLDLSAARVSAANVAAKQLALFTER